MSEGMPFDFGAPVRAGPGSFHEAEAPPTPGEATASSLPGPGDVVLVTGASGFVGAAVARRLARTGCGIRTLMRPTSPRSNVAGLGVDIREGDMRDPAAVASAMRGVRFVIHAAADYRLWALDPGEILDCNERGTRIVMEAALDAGVEKIVHTSSVATLAPCRGGRPSDERDRLPPCKAIGAYKRSKILAEAVVDGLVADSGLPAVIVHPSIPIGPGDIKPTPTGRIIVEAARGRIPAFVETGLNLVHVDDVADGHVRALERGRVGERYILGGHDVAFATMLAEIACLCSRRAPTIRVPHSAIYPIAYAAEMAARVTKREPFVSLDSLRMSHVLFFAQGRGRTRLHCAFLRLGHRRRHPMVRGARLPAGFRVNEDHGDQSGFGLIGTSELHSIGRRAGEIVGVRRFRTSGGATAQRQGKPCGLRHDMYADFILALVEADTKEHHAGRDR